jgi:hypothetical protein
MAKLGTVATTTSETCEDPSAATLHRKKVYLSRIMGEQSAQTQWASLIFLQR